MVPAHAQAVDAPASSEKADYTIILTRTGHRTENRTRTLCGQTLGLKNRESRPRLGAMRCTSELLSAFEQAGLGAHLNGEISLASLADAKLLFALRG